MCSSPTRVMSAGFQPEPRRADGDVGRAAADGLGEGRHVLQPPADLLAIEVDGGAADGDDVEGVAGWRRPMRTGGRRGSGATSFPPSGVSARRSARCVIEQKFD